MPYKLVFNPFTSNLDYVVAPETFAHADLSDMPDVGGTNDDHDERYYTEAEVTALLANFLRLDCANDPLTNGLEIEPNYAPSPASTTDYSLYAHRNIVLKSGQKMIFDG